MTDRMPYVYFPQCTVMTSIMAIFYYMLQVVLVCDLDIPSHHTPPRLCPLMGTSMPAAFSAADRVQLLTAWKLSISSTLYFFPAPSVCDPGLLVLFNPRKLRCFGVPAPLLFIAFRNASVWYRSPPGVGVVATLGEEGRSVTPGDWNEALCFNLHHPFHAHHVCAVLRPCLVPGHEITIEGIAFRRARPAEGHSGSVSKLAWALLDYIPHFSELWQASHIETGILSENRDLSLPAIPCDAGQFSLDSLFKIILYHYIPNFTTDYYSAITGHKWHRKLANERR